jgi:UDP-N-acetyl-D-mannosaminuronic acid dehydrogenase
VKITVAGLGYIGLPTAAILAESGHEVVGYDVDRERVAALAAGEIPCVESGVHDLVRRVLQSGRLHPSPRPYPADAFIICVPTPTIEHRADLRAVESAFSAIAPLLAEGNLIVVESTVPPGSTLAIAERVLQPLGRDLDDVHLAHCPERVLPGRIVEELYRNDRIVGGRRTIDAEIARSIYASFARGKIHLTDLVTAETVKVVENAYRAVNIAFANELAILAGTLGVDPWETIELANCHPRVNILAPGPGVGGHCIPVDPQFLAEADPFATELIQTARRVNERMPHVVVRQIREMVPARSGAKITLLGAAYKADVDDARETPSLVVERLLRESGYDVLVYDPLVSRYQGKLTADFAVAARGSDLLVLMTAHSAILELEPQAVAKLVRSRKLLDTRNALDASRWADNGFEVRLLGCGAPAAAALAGAA